ncbi:G-type lectin S-receptor-like serine/threonine-protein kinase LECRK2 [Euphorbia peplus]|nr:G-type lectin S-receptor-like serine/threonine-protein kinase LECRK2 [Euphorbia peplus]
MKFPFSILILVLNFCCLHCQISTNISLGSGITAGSNDSWRSVSGEFAFGFYPLEQNLYLVGIWLEKIPEKTLVWSADRDDPAQAGSTIRLTFSGQLFLTHTNGSIQAVYSGEAASLGFMQDNGNFVLKDANSRMLWQSFDSPTDTILPGQILTPGSSLLSSVKDSYSTGNFMLQMQFDGNLVLSAYRFSDPGYWYTATLQSNVSLVFNPNGSMYLVNSTNDNVYAMAINVSSPIGDYFHRARIDDRGNFQHLVYRKSNGSGWKSVWKAVDEPCFVNSVCGVNGMCSSPDNETVTCNCIPGHVPLDPDDVSKGCRTETVMNFCADPSMKNFTIEVIDDADFPFEGFADLDRVLNVDTEGCKEALRNDCYSLAASLVDSRCNKKRMPLLNARKSASTKGIKAFVKVPMKVTVPDPDRQNANSRNHFDVRTFLKISLIVSAAFALLFGTAATYYHPATRNFFGTNFSSSATGINFREFTYQELNQATNEFSKILGRGSSGHVYSGTLRLKDVQIDIAVKRLTREIDRSNEEFMTELKIIGRTHHKNLVRLLGFCIEDNQRLLVYELMANGTVSNLLFGKGEKPNWGLRTEIVIEIARGLLYLHEECEAQIIHCDIKPQNVLLDANYNAKISDFGMSKLLNKDQTRTNTNLRGTVGYLAPEWLRNAPVTYKVDIYSYGVLLLEILCCRRHIELNRVEEESEEDDLVLSDWVASCIIEGNLETVIADDDVEILSDFKRFERMILVGLWCIHPDPLLRPSMNKVLQMLEQSIEVELEIPPLLQQQLNYMR